MSQGYNVYKKSDLSKLSYKYINHVKKKFKYPKKSIQRKAPKDICSKESIYTEIKFKEGESKELIYDTECMVLAAYVFKCFKKSNSRNLLKRIFSGEKSKKRDSIKQYLDKCTFNGTLRKE